MFFGIKQLNTIIEHLEYLKHDSHLYKENTHTSSSTLKHVDIPGINERQIIDIRKGCNSIIETEEN